MRFQVPQFIEVEDKIFGPFTFKQFVYLLGGTGLSVALYLSIPKIVAFPLIAVVIAFSLALAFYKVNNKPFINVLLSAINYYSNSRLYVWKTPKPKKIEQTIELPKTIPTLAVPKITEGNLKERAWSLGVSSSIYATSEKDNTPGQSGSVTPEHSQETAPATVSEESSSESYDNPLLSKTHPSN